MKKPMTKADAKRLRFFVYDLLTKTPYTPENPIDQRQVYEKCVEAGFDVTWDETQNQHADHCRWLTKIVDELACDSDFDKVVWHMGYRYFACDYEEAELLLRLREERICLASVRIRKLKKKIRRHRQGKILSNTGTPLGKNKKSHTTFIRVTKSKKVYVEGKIQGEDGDLWDEHCPEAPKDKRLAIYREKQGKATILTFKWLSSEEAAQ